MDSLIRIERIEELCKDLKRLYKEENESFDKFWKVKHDCTESINFYLKEIEDVDELKHIKEDISTLSHITDHKLFAHSIFFGEVYFFH